MKGKNPKHIQWCQIKILVLFIVCLSWLSSSAQDVNCREWHFKKDRNGNEIKTVCKVGWTENDIGQKNGKYYENSASGKPIIRANYKNGKLNGRYVAFKEGFFNEPSETVSDSGRYMNDFKYGNWLEHRYYYTSYDRNGTLLKSRYNDGEMKLDGTINENDYYTGKMAIIFKAGLGMSEFFAYSGLDKKSQNFSKKTIEIIDWIFEDHLQETVLHKSFKLICKVSNGDIVDYENSQFYINNVPNQSLLKEKIAAYYTKKRKENEEKDIAKAKQALATEGNKAIIESFKPISITFKADSYEMDAEGEVELQKLSSFLSTVDLNGIKQFIVIGHSGADSKLGKVKFDPTNDRLLYNSSTGNRTMMSEAELANLRFLLSVGRSKSVFIALESLGTVQNIRDAKKFWMLPCGTIFGDELQHKNQNVVQIVILTADNKELNSEIDLVPFGSDFRSSLVLTKVNKNILDLGYNSGKFIPAVIGISTYGEQLPDYTEMASDPTKLAAFKKNYN